MSLGAEDEQYNEQVEGYRNGYSGNPPAGFSNTFIELHNREGHESNTYIQAKTTSKNKYRYEEQAKNEGLELSDWVIKTLNAAIT